MSSIEDGDRERRFRSVHAATYADLLRFVQRRIPPSDAEDVVSTVFLTAWRRFDDLPEDARPWLFAVARRTMANQTRGWLRRQALDVRLVTPDEPAYGDDTVAAAARIDLDRAWRGLRPGDREVLALVAFDGLTAEQAATVLGCRRSTFAMRLGRARERLRAALEPAAAVRPQPLTVLKEQQS
ncbi:RNA polymerase sigma factor [Micromonospora sp. NPDC051925]|uniref:RNA polymerase sigma factor n=1 Tax=Micromonospora sp. NPDC051925 TaxID=3364288 RepID=UPI0037CA3A29